MYTTTTKSSFVVTPGGTTQLLGSCGILKLIIMLEVRSDVHQLPPYNYWTEDNCGPQIYSIKPECI